MIVDQGDVELMKIFVTIMIIGWWVHTHSFFLTVVLYEISSRLKL